MQLLPRRKFLQTSLGLAGAAFLGPWRVPGQPKPPGESRLKAAILGHTGQGNYGHELDLVFNDRPTIEVSAVADPDAAGRARAAARCHAARQYADYRELLAREKPQLVCVAPRWTDQHHAMALAALQSGAHVLTEKPFTQTLMEADELLAVADRSGRKIAVAHQMRLAPGIQRLKTALADGLIGELLEMRAHGKQDHRAGGEDLVVLGTHLFDLMRFFAGDAAWCTARILQNGRAVTVDDRRKATEGIGPVIGDDIEAQFGFSSGVIGNFTSRGKYRQTAGPWGLQLIGSKGVMRILTDIPPTIYALKPGGWSASGAIDQWRPWEEEGAAAQADRGFTAANRRVVDDWLAAIREDREPACSGRNGMKALEMIMAVFQAGLSGARVKIPLAERRHPLQPS